MWPACLIKIRAHSRADLSLCAEAVLCLAVARAAVLALPFRWTTRLFALRLGSAAYSVNGTMLELARNTGWAVRTAATRTPWDSNCLAQSLAGAAMLRRRGIPAEIALGVATGGATGGLEAHAWLSSGGIILTGSRGHQRYRVIANFNLG
jgi:hypothetical protein